MSDKLNLFTSNIIRFVAGERPTADKFNAMNLYYMRAVDNICRVIGDMHDRSTDHPLSPKWNPYEDLNGRPLDIVNLARLIGPASNLNPKTFGSRSIIKEKITFLESKEIELKYCVFKTIDPSELPLNIVYIRAAGIEIYNENDTLVESLNKDNYSFINDKTILLNYDLADNNYILISYFAIGDQANYVGAAFNTIPDPNQEDTFAIEDISTGDTGYSYKIDLSTLNILAQQSGARNLTNSNIGNDESEFNNDLTYKLPNWWENKFDLDGQIKAIPEGILYLKNIVTGEIYLTAEYALTDLQTVYIKSANLCLEDNHRLILAGTDITTSIDDLRNKMFNHRHDGSFGEPFIRIQDLVGKYVTGEFGPSSIPGNEFPMYLHRKGYQEDTNARNGNNAMLGDLFMGSKAFDGSNDLETQILSNKIVFGTSGAYINRQLGALTIKNEESGDTSDIFNIGRGNIVLEAINNIIFNSKNTVINSSENTSLDQVNLIINSTNNTEINSNQETHLKLNNEDVIILKSNEEDTASQSQEITSLNTRSGSVGREWNSSNRSVLVKNNDLENIST